MVIKGIVAYARGDVNGDRVLDNVYLTGEKTLNSPFIKNITLVIQNGTNGKVTTVPLKDNTGYNPALTLRDFSGYGFDDILIGISTGGSGGIMIYYIYSFANNKIKLLFDYNNYNNEYKYEVKYRDYYKVEVISLNNNSKYMLDISYKGNQYLNEIYDNKGRLKKPISGFVNPISGLYPVDFDGNKIYELMAFQKIAGRYNADSLGYIQNIITWEDNKFVLQSQYVAIFGTKK
ncbi:VCBS repeat-containing protein [Haloimpatiens sp. FM7315]|uniref:VCBS repeat-containing protein n=1 Tax=Haloimpatiens sp. FM7315 TaxID=3298609 RepID=UPI0035A2DA1E